MWRTITRQGGVGSVPPDKRTALALLLAANLLASVAATLVAIDVEGGAVQLLGATQEAGRKRNTRQGLALFDLVPVAPAYLQAAFGVIWDGYADKSPVRDHILGDLACLRQSNNICTTT